MIKIKQEEFTNSFYYMGSGLDIQPLLRFTHITSSFIYTNLFLPQKEVEQWYDEQFKFHPDIEVISKEIDNSFDELKSYDLHPDYQDHLLHPHFMEKRDQESYIRAFEKAAKLPQWAITYKLKRKSVDRVIELKILSAEAVASYIALSHNGQFAPKIVATIQTGVLELADSFLNRFFEDESVKLPQQWIRGTAPLDPNDRILAGDKIEQWKPNVLSTKGVFNRVGQNFIHKWITTDDWVNGELVGAEIWHDERHCKSFITDSEEKRIEQLSFSPEYSTEQHKIVNSRIDSDSLNSNDIIVVSQLIADKIKCSGTVLVWEDLLKQTVSDIQNGAQGKYFSWYRNNPLFIDVKIQLDALYKHLNSIVTSLVTTTIHITPFCYEDASKEYCNAINQWGYKTITYTDGLLDFIDIKS